MGSESDVGLDLVFLPGRPRRRRGRRYRGVGRRGIRGKGRGRGEASMAAGRRRGRPGGGSSSITVGRGRRGGGGARADDGLTDRQRQVLLEGWKKQENVFTNHPFSGHSPGPTKPSSGESAGACFNRFFTDEVWDLLDDGYANCHG